MKLYNIGIKDDMSPYMKTKVKLTNQISLMCGFIGFFYSFFIYAHYPTLVVYPILLFVISTTLLLMNHFGLVQLSRFLGSFQMLLMASLFHASILEASDSFLFSFFSSMIAMTLIPWLLYSLQEKFMLALSLLICYGLLLVQGFLNKQFELPVDPAFFRESYLNVMTYMFAFGIAILLKIMIKGDKSEEQGLQMEA